MKLASPGFPEGWRPKLHLLPIEPHSKGSRACRESSTLSSAAKKETGVMQADAKGSPMNSRTARIEISALARNSR